MGKSIKFNSVVARINPGDINWQIRGPSSLDEMLRAGKAAKADRRFTASVLAKDLRFFADGAAKKWPLRGSLKPSGAYSLSCMSDGLSTLYRDLLGGSYDCVGRIVLNAYFPMGHDAGGFRVWWRALTGSDETLDNAYLMRMAGRFSRRIRGYAKAHDIPVIDCPAGQRKHELAGEYFAKTKVTQGLFLVLVGRAQAPVWDIGAKHHIERKKPMPYVNHYSFHILDRDWGHLTIKISGHPPFPAQVILNGHEYVACQARKAGILFTKQGNCFTTISVSGIGADPASSARYIASRGRREIAVQQSFPGAIVIRPAVMFGPDDAFLTTVARLLRILPAYPMFGWGETKLQRVYVEDVAEGIARVLADAGGNAASYEFAGPRVYT
jgi:hypothetical protein